MKAIKILLMIMLGFFAVTVPVYWFNLDTKLVKLIEKPPMIVLKKYLEKALSKRIIHHLNKIN